MKKIEKNDWYLVGISILETEGFGKITIDNLCKNLEVTKGSFYHHFGNIEGYIEELMKYWVYEYTTSFINKADTAPDTGQKYKTLIDMVMKASLKVEQIIRAWSFSHPTVRKYARQVDNIRLDYLTAIWEGNGNTKEVAGRNAILEYAILIGIQQLYPDINKDELLKIYQLYGFKI